MFPVYPEKFRRFAHFVLKIRYYLLAVFLAGIIVFFAGWQTGSDGLLIAGVLIGTFGTMFFGTLHVGDALVSVEISEGGICRVDAKGQRYQNSEYRYLRKAEVRSFQITNISYRAANHATRMFPPAKGAEEKFILVYTDDAFSFDDLKLDQIGKNGTELYWCDKVLQCRNCFVFVYSDEAWKLLNKYLNTHKY